MSHAIEFEGIHKHLGKREVLRDISFTVEPGDIFGYLGPNGAGKTTTIRILLGLLDATSGKASISGQDARSDATRKKVGFVLESDGLYDNMTAYQNLLYYARIYDVSQPGERTGRFLDMVGLKDRAGDKVGTYSKGMRQRLVLARAMIHGPEVLILDEPTSGVDPSGQIEVRQIILDAAHKEGKTIFLSSHNLDEVQRICNRIALIDRGKIKLYGERDKLQREMGKGLVLIETTETVPGPVLAELKGRPGTTVESQTDKTLVLSLGNGTVVPDVVSFLALRGVKIEQVKRMEASLEEIYTAIMKEVEK